MAEYRVVLVGIDGSEVAHDALKFAADEANTRQAKLVVVHVGDVPAYDHGARAIEVHEYANILRNEAVATVAAMHAHLACETVVCEGDPARVLVELSSNADLLVVGTHKMGRLRGFVLGSVSQRVASHAACPVITISGETSRNDGPIILGASSSPGGMAALRFACEEAQVRGVPVHAIRATAIADWATPGFGYPMAMSSDALQYAAQGELQIVLKAAAEEFPDVTVTGETSMADPFVVLENATKTAALVVLGSRRDAASGLPHLGPVAAWLLHQAQCPLAVVNFVGAEHETAPAGASELSGSITT